MDTLFSVFSAGGKATRTLLFVGSFDKASRFARAHRGTVVRNNGEKLPVETPAAVEETPVWSHLAPDGEPKGPAMSETAAKAAVRAANRSYMSLW